MGMQAFYRRCAYESRIVVYESALSSLCLSSLCMKAFYRHCVYESVLYRKRVSSLPLTVVVGTVFIVRCVIPLPLHVRLTMRMKAFYRVVEPIFIQHSRYFFTI
jgi:hypothetical protein